MKIILLQKCDFVDDRAKRMNGFEIPARWSVDQHFVFTGFLRSDPALSKLTLVA